MFLDTNYLIASGRSGSSAAVQVDEWILKGEPLHVSAIAWSEYLCGPLHPSEEQASRALLQGVHPVSEAIATFAAQLFNQTGRRTRSLSDCIIAATAILAREPLATLNVADFRPFESFGLILV